MNSLLSQPTLVFFAIAGGVLIVGFGGLGVLAHRRERLVREFQGALKVFVNTFREGRSFHEAVLVLADLAPRPLDGEFRRMRQELARGLDQTRALQNLSQRIPCFEARYLAEAVSVCGDDSARLYSALIRLDSLKHRRALALQQVAALNGFARRAIRAALLCVPLLLLMGFCLPTSDLRVSLSEIASKPVFGLVVSGVVLALVCWVLILQKQDEAEIVLD